MKRYITMLIAVLLIAGSVSALSAFAEAYSVGDANRDGTVNVKDATAIQRYAASLLDFSDEELRLADVDADGRVNVKDATMIQKFVAGLVERFPAETKAEGTLPDASSSESIAVSSESTETSANTEVSTTTQEDTNPKVTEPTEKDEPTEGTDFAQTQPTNPSEPQATPPSKDDDGYFNQIVRP